MGEERPASAQLLVVALFALVAGASGLFVVPPLDRDESRFVQATTQMVESGDYVRIRYQETERNKKPVGIHWLQAASARALGGVEDREVWTYRVPSLIGGVLAAVFTCLCGAALFGRRAGLVAGLLLAGAPVLLAEATIAKTDAVLLACVCGAMAALARLWAAKGRPWGPAIAFWAALAVGLLIKGPIAPMVVGLTVSVLVAARWRAGGRRLAASLRPLPGLLLLALVVSPWLVAIGLATEGRFFSEAIGRDMIGKVGEAQESHAGPFGYHAILVWVMFWPAALYLPAALRAAASARAEPGVLFCLAWLVPSWLVFEAAGTKLPHYTMVLYPAIALLIGWFVTTAPMTHRWWRWAGAAVFGAVGVVAAAGVVALPVVYGDGLDPIGVLLAVIVVALVIGVVFLAVAMPGRRGPIGAALASAVLGWALFQHVLPGLDALAVTPRLAASLEEAGAHPRRGDALPVALVGYHEPSAVFVLGTETRLTDAEGAAAWLAAAPGRVAAVEGRDAAAFRAAAAGLPLERVGVVEGLNYSNGRDVRLTLYRSVAP